MKKNNNLIASMNLKLFILNPKLYITYFLIQIIWAGTPFLCAYIISGLFDHLQAKEEVTFYLGLAIFFAVDTISIFLIQRAGIIDILISFSAGKYIKNNLLRSIVEIKKIHISNSGTVLDILNYDIGSMQYMLLTQIDLLSQILVILIEVIVLINKNIYFTLAVILPVILLTCLVWRLSELYKARYSKERSSSIEFSRYVSETINNREAIQYLANQEDIVRRFNELREKRGKNKIRKQFVTAFMNTNLSLINNFGSFSILLGYMILRSSESITIGELTLFLSFIGYATAFLQLINAAAYGIREGEDALGRIAKLLDCDLKDSLSYLTKKRESDAECHEPISEVQFTDFRLSDKDQYHNFCVCPGDLLVVTGENRSGKSCFLNAVMGYTPYDGELSGIDPDSMIGYVSQEVKLFDDDINTNISIYEDKQDLDQYKQSANLEESLCAADKKVGVNGKELSEGQRQRVAIARALCNQSGLIILDDAFSYLDKDNREQIIQNIRKNKNIVLMVTNDINMIELATKVIHMEDLVMKE